MIITVSRQFGSGGRELGKRLADALKLKYYDRELVTKIAEDAELDENYVASVLESGGSYNPSLTLARSLPALSSTPAALTDVLVAQQQVIEAIGEKGNCLIVGRCADVILHDYHPINIFVYADEKSKLARCRERTREGENLSDRQLVKYFKQIDKGRARLHDLLSATDWGAKEGYDLMINTSGADLEKLVAPLAALIRAMDR